jgi:hypothetical protein
MTYSNAWPRATKRDHETAKSWPQYTNCSWLVGFMLNATFNNISAMSWQSVLLVEETVGPGENHRPAVSHWQNLSHNVSYTSPTSVVICTDCIGSYKSNYHTITTTAVTILTKGYPNLKGMLSSKGTIWMHNYNGTSIKIKQKQGQHEIREKKKHKKTGSETRCFERINISCPIILAPVVMS